MAVSRGVLLNKAPINTGLNRSKDLQFCNLVEVIDDLDAMIFDAMICCWSLDSRTFRT